MAAGLRSRMPGLKEEMIGRGSARGARVRALRRDDAARSTSSACRCGSIGRRTIAAARRSSTATRRRRRPNGSTTRSASTPAASSAASSRRCAGRRSELVSVPAARVYCRTGAPARRRPKTVRAGRGRRLLDYADVSRAALDRHHADEAGSSSPRRTPPRRLKR